MSKRITVPACTAVRCPHCGSDKLDWLGQSKLAPIGGNKKRNTALPQFKCQSCKKKFRYEAKPAKPEELLPQPAVIAYNHFFVNESVEKFRDLADSLDPLNNALNKVSLTGTILQNTMEAIEGKPNPELSVNDIYVWFNGATVDNYVRWRETVEFIVQTREVFIGVTDRGGVKSGAGYKCMLNPGERVEVKVKPGAFKASLEEVSRTQDADASSLNNTSNIGNDDNNDENTEEVTIPVIEMLDEDGELLQFELLDTIKYRSNTYALLTPFDEEQENNNGPAELYVVRVVEESNGEGTYEAVEDDELVNKIYSLFMDMHGDEFDFK